MDDPTSEVPAIQPALAGRTERHAATGTDEILTAVGEVAYEWTIATDAIAWGGNVADVLGLSSAEPVANGRGYALLLDPANLTSRHDAVLNGTAGDTGQGVSYEVQYVLLPDGVGGARRLIVEDSGRWFADPTGRPERARGVIRIINERHEREQRLAFLSRYDELTGYFNRQHLLATLGEALNNAKRFRGSIAFLIVAVDSFRAINEAYGFETADQVFAAAARRIKTQLRDGDAIGRYSGNKLGIVLMNCDDDAMHAAAERFHAAIRNGVITAGDSSVAVTVSIGGVSLPRHGRTVNEALARAQESLHSARTRGYGRFVAYTPSANRDARRRANAALSSEMVAALETNHLRLFFQPVVDLKTRVLNFHEGLLRLERSNGTFAPATDFIELCEQLGLIRLVDKYTLGKTLEALEANPAARLSLNVSGETVGDAEWLSRLAAAVSRRPDLAGRLIVEITETAVIRNIEEAAHFVATIHDLGCPVAIDDFGAGFSSFRHLRTLDVDMVKIAGEFIQNLPRSKDDQAFVKALTELARNFDIEIVAEWVQDEETATLLAGYGIDFIQGTLTGMASPEWALTNPRLPARRAG
ncbi:MAG TPA: bifunctional diguanylate cyclase/phosphodiesterase [Bauldia sp.]|nr:bifunctional diguanylate cyclase/phosphodiesterase [Bauldia sp.]